jgi:hypothetical protein
MVSSSLSVLVGALFVLLASLNAVDASANYQVAAFFQSTPLTAEIAALAQSLAMFESLGQYLLNCEFLEPGKSSAGRDRDLAVRDETAMLRGSQGEEGRDLAVSTCPSACSTSGSTKCKSLGCAFCDRCRRRRKLPYSSLSFFGSGSSGSTTNSTTGTTTANTTSGTTSSNATAGSNFTGTSSQALEIEKGFNDLLKPYCVGSPGCKIWTKIYRVLDNGTMYPLTG